MYNKPSIITYRNRGSTGGYFQGQPIFRSTIFLSQCVLNRQKKIAEKNAFSGQKNGSNRFTYWLHSKNDPLICALKINLI